MLKKCFFLSVVFLWLLPSGTAKLAGYNLKHETTLASVNTEAKTLWIYENLNVNSFQKPSFPVFSKALHGFLALREDYALEKNILVIIDFSKPSSKERMWVVDLDEMSITDQLLVSHGKNSGELYAEKFSNTVSSYQSSLGFYVTGSIYTGKHGMSLYLHGMEPGINDKAKERAIVMHSADYVSHTFVEQHGRLGRSQGCPAIPIEKHQEIIPLLAEGACLFIYHPTESYLKQSTLLKADKEELLANFIKQLPHKNIAEIK
ncbi:MAG: murein L,D-transpeptidase catalytic domain family protein [Luteibaculaceae bacterium]